MKKYNTLLFIILTSLISIEAHADSCDAPDVDTYVNIPDESTYVNTSIFLYELFSQAGDNSPTEPRWSGGCTIDPGLVSCHCYPGLPDKKDCDWFKNACSAVGGTESRLGIMKICYKET